MLELLNDRWQKVKEPEITQLNSAVLHGPGGSLVVLLISDADIYINARTKSTGEQLLQSCTIYTSCSTICQARISFFHERAAHQSSR